MKILVISPIDPGAIAHLGETHEVECAFGAAGARLGSLLRDCEVLVFRSGVTVSADAMKAAPRLRLLIRAGSGFDNVDHEYAAGRGIGFVRIPEPGARAVAEMAFALMLALARNIVPADREWRRGRWVKHDLESHLLEGKVLGIVGTGNIGRCVGRLGAAWGMRPIGCVRTPSERTRRELAASGIRLATFDEVVEAADFLSIHLPLTDATRNLIDGSVLARMKRGARLVNLARGGVVDESALRRALLEGGRLRGAALDVHAAEGEGRISPLADLPNVVLTPHIGATTVDTQREIGRRVVSIVEELADAGEGDDAAGIGRRAAQDEAAEHPRPTAAPPARWGR